MLGGVAICLFVCTWPRWKPLRGVDTAFCEAESIVFFSDDVLDCHRRVIRCQGVSHLISFSLSLFFSLSLSFFLSFSFSLFLSLSLSLFLFLFSPASICTFGTFCGLNHRSCGHFQVTCCFSRSRVSVPDWVRNLTSHRRLSGNLTKIAKTLLMTNSFYKTT